MASNKLVRYTKDETDLHMIALAREIRKHVGTMVLMFKEERRRTIPQLMLMESFNKGKIILSKECYGSLGELRGHLSTCVSLVDVYCGQVKFKYFDRDI